MAITAKPVASSYILLQKREGRFVYEIKETGETINYSMGKWHFIFRLSFFVKENMSWKFDFINRLSHCIPCCFCSGWLRSWFCYGILFNNQENNPSSCIAWTTRLSKSISFWLKCLKKIPSSSNYYYRPIQLSSECYSFCFRINK